MQKNKVVLSFSGKDSTLALHDILEAGEYDIDSLLVTITEGFNRLSVHGVREELIMAQSQSLGIPLRVVRIPQNCSNDIYQQIMGQAMEQVRAEGIEHIAFGDIFLEDVRKYREDMLIPAGFKPLFPLWGQPTTELIERFISLGYQTMTTCVDLEKLSEAFSGRNIDRAFIQELPLGVDPCGENGEYHSFVYDGPIFNKRIKFRIGEKKVTPDMVTGKPRFCYTDLMLV